MRLYIFFYLYLTLCQTSTHVSIMHLPYVIVLLSTVLFLLVTFTFYAVQSDRSNFHSLCLMSYLMALTLGYFCLAVGQHTLDWTKLNISLLGFTMYAAFMSAFLWLNIISFDIIWNFQYVICVVAFKVHIITIYFTEILGKINNLDCIACWCGA